MKDKEIKNFIIQQCDALSRIAWDVRYGTESLNMAINKVSESRNYIEYITQKNVDLTEEIKKIHDHIVKIERKMSYMMGHPYDKRLHPKDSKSCKLFSFLKKYFSKRRQSAGIEPT